MLQYSLFFNNSNSVKNSIEFLEKSKLTYDPFFVSSEELARLLSNLTYFDSFVHAHKIFWTFDSKSKKTDFFITEQRYKLWLDSFGAFYNFPVHAKRKILEVYPYKVFFDEANPQGSLIE